MRKSLMDILVCPVCKGPVTLTVTTEQGDEIVAGTIRCGKCTIDYPIADSIPNLIPPEMRA
ncbi:MAG: methytransferase partner Trm112 [Chloroflexi bacterium]|nr:methytransferase partner Trm112 [Chloroflexota bacterium]